MPTVTISKNVRENCIEVCPKTVVTKRGDTLVFVVVGTEGLRPGEEVRVEFRDSFSVLPPFFFERRADFRGPFEPRPDCKENPEEGVFVFSEPGEFITGAVRDEVKFLSHYWKYGVKWTGLPDLDPRVKVEKSG